MDIMNGIKNFLMMLDTHWVDILVIIGLVIGIMKKIESYLSLTTDEKITIAKTQISEAMLKMITTAEVDFEKWNQSGSIKRSQVITQVFNDYPILSKAVNQEEIIAWIDEQINESLKTLRKIVKENTDSKEGE